MIAYQVHQFFRPGEITPDEANRIGYEFAERFLKGNHAFIVCTHTDKQHIHNNIYWNSTSLDCTRKFLHFWGSTMAVQKLSDLICVQHRLSVIENPKPHGINYNRWQNRKSSLLEEKQNRGCGCYYDLTIQNQITKLQARGASVLSAHGFTSADDFDTFAESVEDVKQCRGVLSAQIKSTEKQLNKIAVFLKHITNYLKIKDIYVGYRASSYSKAYYEEHKDAIKLCKAYKCAFDELFLSDTSGKTAGSHKKQLPTLKALREEYAELLAMKKAAYPEYYRAKDEYRELLTCQANLTGLFSIENIRSAPPREYQQKEK